MRLQNLLKQEPALAARLTPFDPFESAALAGGLHLFAELRANSVRLELLSLTVASICRGRRALKMEHLTNTLKALTSVAAHLEDPIEDSLVANVYSAKGNRLVLLGRWDSLDFWLQQTLNAYGSIGASESTEYIAADALLVLSDLLLSRASLLPETEGGGRPGQRPLVLPGWGDMQEAAGWVTFQTAELEQAGISVAHLEPFVFSALDHARSLEAEFDFAPLHLRPLLRAGNRWVVAMPSSIGRAAHLSLLRAATHHNLARQLGNHMLEAEKEELRKVVGKLNGRELSVQFTGEGRPRLGSIDLACSFDENRACLFVLIPGRVPHEPTSSEDELIVSPEVAGEVDALVGWCLNRLRETGFTGGLVMLLAGGGGGVFRLRLPNLPPDWHYFNASIPNLIALSSGEDATFLRVWRMACARDEARGCGTRIVNMSDDFNMYCHWEHIGFRILPTDGEGNKCSIVAVDSTSYSEARHRFRMTDARHASWHPSERRWIEVERFNTHAFFVHLRNEPFFVDSLALKDRILRASIETESGSCWIDAVRSKAPGGAALVYNIWKSVAHWVLAVLLQRPAAIARGDRYDQIHLSLEDGAWDREAIMDELSVRSPLAFELKDSVLHLKITVGYLRAFADPVNIAERELVGVLVRFLHGDGSKLLDVTSGATVITADDQRYFHLFPRPTALRIDATDSLPPRFVPSEIRAETHRTLSGILRKLVAGRKNLSKGETVNVIHRAVDEIHCTILGILGDFERESVVRVCLDNHANVTADRELWYLTAAANLATSPDREEVRRVAFEREGERSIAAQASRLIVEAALIVCAKEGARPLSRDAFERLMSLFEELVLIANHSDAVSSDVATPGVKFAEDGELMLDISHYESIAVPLNTAAFDLSFTRSAADYADAFTEQALLHPTDRDLQFLAAFLAEFGFSVESLAKAELTLQRWAIQQKSRIMTMRRSAMVSWLASEADIPDREAEKMVSELCLPLRSGFGADLPPGVLPAEEYPWRYRRRLSVLWRPIVQIDASPDPKLMVCTDLFGTMSRYRCYYLFAGIIPAERMQSREMRELIGNSAVQRGHVFAKRIHNLLQEAGLLTWFERELESLGAPRGPRGWGDIDVLAYHATTARLIAIECKDLVQVRSVSEMVAQMKDYRGQEGDDLWKHEKRVAWLRGNLAAVGKRLGLPDEPQCVEDFVATGGWVPMAFDTAGGRSERFVHVSELLSRLRV